MSHISRIWTNRRECECYRNILQKAYRSGFKLFNLDTGISLKLHKLLLLGNNSLGKIKFRLNIPDSKKEDNENDIYRPEGYESRSRTPVCEYPGNYSWEYHYQDKVSQNQQQ